MNSTSAVDHSCLPSRQWRHGPAVVGLLALVALATLPACWDGSAGFPGVHLTVKGVVQKGPPAASLVLALAQSDGGSLGAPQAIAATWAAGGRYQFDAVAAEGLIEVSARGRFFDEIRNADAADDIELKVAIPLVTTSRELQANVNVLTTLVAARIRSLVADGVEVTDATARAEHEFNLQFPLAQAAGTPGKFHLIDLAGSGDADAYGLVISLAFLQASHDSGVRPQVLLSQWTADFADKERTFITPARSKSTTKQSFRSIMRLLTLSHLQGLDATTTAAAVAMGIRRLSFPTGDASAAQHAKAPHVMIPSGASPAVTEPVAR